MRRKTAPRFLVFAGLAICAFSAVSTEPIQEAAGNTIGYPTVAAALVALKSKKGTSVTIQQGWTLIEDTASGNVTLWSFTPADHPAHPSAVKRSLINRDGGTHLEMSVRCEAEKVQCDALVRDFQELNAQMTRYTKDKRP